MVLSPPDYYVCPNGLIQTSSTCEVYDAVVVPVHSAVALQCPDLVDVGNVMVRPKLAGDYPITVRRPAKYWQGGPQKFVCESHIALGDNVSTSGQDKIAGQDLVDRHMAHGATWLSMDSLICMIHL